MKDASIVNMTSRPCLHQVAVAVVSGVIQRFATFLHKSER